MSNQDPRYLRSGVELKSAMQELLKEKQYADISILEITKRAKLSRPTFYLHYPTKEALLVDCFEDMELQVLQELKFLRAQETLDYWRTMANRVLFREFRKNDTLILTIFNVNQSLFINSLVRINKPFFGLRKKEEMP